jgi:hypothetical protein
MQLQLFITSRKDSKRQVGKEGRRQIRKQRKYKK